MSLTEEAIEYIFGLYETGDRIDLHPLMEKLAAMSDVEVLREYDDARVERDVAEHLGQRGAAGNWMGIVELELVRRKRLPLQEITAGYGFTEMTDAELKRELEKAREEEREESHTFFRVAAVLYRMIVEAEAKRRSTTG